MKTPPEAIKDLLLEDYRYRAEALKNSEQGGETRINIFIGVVTLVAGGLVTFFTTESGPREQAYYLIVLCALLVLLVLGLVTLGRLLIRNKNTDQCKRDLDHIRQMFKDHFDDSGTLIGYYPVGGPKANAKDRGTDDRTVFGQLKKDSERGFGGLAHMMAAINSMLLAGIAGFGILLLPAGSLPLPGLAGVFAAGGAALIFFLGMFLQLLYVARHELHYTLEIEGTRATHAGAVVYDPVGNNVEYLLISPKKPDKSGKKIWVLPKGKIKKGEGDLEAAVREVAEEAGVAAKLICPLGFVKYKDAGKPIIAKYYLLEKLFFTPLPHEEREKEWQAFDKARQQLTHEEGKHLLLLAERKLTERGGETSK